MKNEDADFGWGVVVNFCKKANVKVGGAVVGHPCDDTSTMTVSNTCVCVWPGRAQSRARRCTWWRCCCTAARTVSKMQRQKLLNLQLLGKPERCRWVDESELIGLGQEVLDWREPSESFLFCCPAGGPSDAAPPHLHQLSPPLHPQRPEALRQPAAHAQVHPGRTQCCCWRPGEAQPVL